MATAAVTVRMSVEEYLQSSFEPDAEYVDGFIEERAVGEYDHAKLQTVLLRLLGGRELEWGVDVSGEIRVQVSTTRFRVPDVCVLDAEGEAEQIIRTAPLLCIEVLSPEDRLPRMLKRVQDFHGMGVGQVWVFNPKTRRVWVSTADGAVEHLEGELRVAGTEIVLDPAVAFAMMARRRKQA